ncbi:MAG: endonuclease III [Nitrospira sp.]|nr:endonuclease III [Candidatus Manganitrophaceae bacterium]HIL35818.1 endonuclease III [Candidatus Manganitrophaceae bacterium]
MKQEGQVPENRRRALVIIKRLEKAIPIPETALHHKSPFQLLVATILSAQCTDARVNLVTPPLFQRYPTPDNFSKARLEDLETLIRTTGFYRNKAKNIVGCAKALVHQFKGQVPNSMDALLTLPGVGRKTANVVLGSVFGKPAVVVDTHVRRVAKRLELTKSNSPDQIEIDLGRLLPKKKWTSGAHRILLHGRHVCTARKPHCLECSLFKLCPAEEEKRRAVEGSLETR